jgi:hypothetical protein
VEGYVSFFRRRGPLAAAGSSAGGWPPSRWDVVSSAINGGNLDIAAASLLEWCDAAVTDDVEDDNAHRTDCRQLVDRATAFLEAAGGGRHPLADEVFEGMARTVYEACDLMTADNTAGFTRLLRRRHGLPVPGPGDPPIPTDDVAFLTRYGRYRFLGWEAAGETGPIDDWYSHLMRWFEPLMAGPPGYQETVTRLNNVATIHGGWVAIGAWKVMLEFSSDLAGDGRDALVACLRAYHDFGVTNLALHIPPVELTVWCEIFDFPPPNDGFFTPPVFSTPYGPKKADYLKAAATAAATRYPQRLDHVPGVPPAASSPDGVLEKQLAYSLWDFGQLLLLGAHVMREERRYEPAILARARSWAEGTNHRLVLDRLVEMVEANPDPAWGAVGAARFCEEYLDASLTGSEAHRFLLEAGLGFLVRQNLLQTSIDPACLSPAEVEGLHHWTEGA